MPKVSIIIPVYNCEKDIGRCIESIIAQEMQDFELIVVNDGSTDDTENVVLQRKERLGEKLKYYYKKNTGVADTRNYGLDRATGEYIMYIDSDDYIDKNLLLNQEENMDNHIDVIKYRMIQVDENGKEIAVNQGPVFPATSGQAAFNELYYQDVIMDSPCIYLIKRQYLLSNNFRFLKGTYHEDFGLIPLIIANAGSMISTDVYGYYYVQSENSIMRNANISKTIKKMRDSFLHYDNMLKAIQTQELSDFTKDNLKLYYTNSILLKIQDLPKELKKQFIQEFQKRKMARNIKIRNIKQLIKRIAISINVNLYFRLR